jgi:hypothetical protein
MVLKRDNMERETFIKSDDTEARCSICYGRKEKIRVHHPGKFDTVYWKYIATRKTCKHHWEKDDYDMDV